MKVAKSGPLPRIELDEGPKVKSCRPSVDVLFDSAAAAYGDRLVAAVLTGMGDDGLDSSRRLAEQGVEIIVQDEATSIVWGMPGAIAKAGIAEHCLPLDKIPAVLTTAVVNSRLAASAPRSSRTR